ncbi:MAG: hypothetical protein H8D77_00640 [Chloroflexi bacterium]|nr:hypothetical protein [Chloroflexota bacterium]
MAFLSDTATQGGREQQIPPHAAAITFAFPWSSYVPTINTGVGYTIVLAPTDFFTVILHLGISKQSPVHEPSL